MSIFSVGGSVAECSLSAVSMSISIELLSQESGSIIDGKKTLLVADWRPGVSPSVTSAADKYNQQIKYDSEAGCNSLFMQQFIYTDKITELLQRKYLQ